MGADAPPKPASHTGRSIEGWTVHVDDRLLSGADKELGERALRLIANRLFDVALVLPAEKVARLRQVPIWLDRTHGKLVSAQYHPSVEWLRENGYSEALAKCVHIPDAADYASLNHQRVQPWSLLHELAHAYHDQVLGFENPEIRAAWEKFKASGKYASVRYINGSLREHYALTDPKEFFAEMSEAFFGMNDFFPFNRGELKHEEPEIFALLERLWGTVKQLPLPGETFSVEGRQAFSIVPAQGGPRKNIPWVWYAPTLPGLPGPEEKWMFERFLTSGVAIAGIDVGESYGSPKGRKLYSALFSELTTKRHFAKKAVLLARSRGGLMLYNWAAENPGRVAGIAGIYPVCNLTSYPGVEKASAAYDLTPDELADDLAAQNPIERLLGLAQAKVPILHIHGDSDTVVPLATNTAEVERRYGALGGSMRVILAKGEGHNMWPGFFQCQELVDFVVQQALSTASQ